MVQLLFPQPPEVEVADSMVLVWEREIREDLEADPAETAVLRHFQAGEVREYQDREIQVADVVQTRVLFELPAVEVQAR
jgi:hypothetical protein